MILFKMLSDDNLLMSFVPKSIDCCVSSDFTFTKRTLRLSPRTMLVTVPLTGEAKPISGDFFSTNKNCPAKT